MLFSQKRYTPDPNLSFKASRPASTIYALTANVVNTVVFNTIVYDLSSLYNISNGRFTSSISSTEWWDFQTNFTWTNAGTLQTLSGYFYLNGSPYELAFTMRSDVSSIYSISCSCLNVPINNGDYVDFRIVSNVTNSITSAASTSGVSNFFKGRRVSRN